jgi:hypothetical protein
MIERLTGVLLFGGSGRSTSNIRQKDMMDAPSLKMERAQRGKNKRNGEFWNKRLSTKTSSAHYMIVLRNVNILAGLFDHLVTSYQFLPHFPVQVQAADRFTAIP